jgi:hypothetical protein
MPKMKPESGDRRTDIYGSAGNSEETRQNRNFQFLQINKPNDPHLTVAGSNLPMWTTDSGSATSPLQSFVTKAFSSCLLHPDFARNFFHHSPAQVDLYPQPAHPHIYPQFSQQTAVQRYVIRPANDQRRQTRNLQTIGVSDRSWLLGASACLRN